MFEKSQAEPFVDNEIKTGQTDTVLTISSFIFAQSGTAATLTFSTRITELYTVEIACCKSDEAARDKTYKVSPQSSTSGL